jgi:ubiquinone/menaquinone biosynthesis C-methylase UbiE
MLHKDLEQEERVSEAFSKQSPGFDEADTKNPILQWMRSRVREHVLGFWKPGEHILELNAGTGLDAIFFGEKGFYTHATDNAPGMLSVLDKRIKELHLEDKITTQRCSFMNLGELNAGKFDHIFSNFGGLNCTDKLEDVISSFSILLKPGGTVTLVIMPPFCPWEFLYLFKGNFKLAFRRWKKSGAPSHLEGVNFTTWYYSTSDLERMFGKNYSIFSVIGLGVIVPPPFLEKFPEKYPKIFKRLTSFENGISAKAPFHSWADHFIISAKKLE